MTETAVRAISYGAAASGTVMSVCPGTRRALELLATHPEVPVGVHLALEADFPTVAWFR